MTRRFISRSKWKSLFFFSLNLVEISRSNSSCLAYTYRTSEICTYASSDPLLRWKWRHSNSQCQNCTYVKEIDLSRNTKRGDFRFLEYLSHDHGDRRETLMTLKSGSGGVSIERTRKDRFRQAVRSVTKVAFSQLGLGKWTHCRRKLRIVVVFFCSFRWFSRWLRHSWWFNLRCNWIEIWTRSSGRKRT